MVIQPIEMQLIEDIFAFTAGIVAIGCFTGIVTTWIKWRGKRGAAAPELTAKLDAIADRLTRLDTAVDAMSVEIERISEGQRFTTKLLAERPAAAPALPERSRGAASSSTTPH
jgi:hypothetical protein